MNNFFDLKPYFDNYVYVLRYFDVLVSEKSLADGITKNEYLTEKNISTTSFRRCQQNQQNIAQSITCNLCNIFNISLFPKSKLRNIQTLFDDIYLNFYFKKEIGMFLPQIEDYIKQETTLKPLFLLFKLLINLSSYNSPKIALMQNTELYQAVKSCKKFFSKDFADLLIIIDILYSSISIEEIQNAFHSDSKFASVFYQVLCYRAYSAGKYGLAIYYGNLAKEKFTIDLNFSRILSVNLTLYSSLNSIKEFQVVYNEAPKQIDYYRFNNITDKRYFGTINHYIVSCLGLKNYEEAIQILTNNYATSVKEYVYLLFAYYVTDKTEYQKFYSKLEQEKIEDFEVIRDLKAFFENPKEANFKTVLKYNLNRGFMEVIQAKFNLV